MKSVFEHTQSNILVIPQALFAMTDVTVLSQYRNSAIFYKNLAQDLVDIEFYTNTPCFIYIETGREVITNSLNETIELQAGDAIFLPQGVKLQSDFVKQTESLKAYLVFFDDEVVIDYLRKQGNTPEDCQQTESYCVIEGGNEFSCFFESFIVDIRQQGYLLTKLQELLHLIAWRDRRGIFHSLLSATRLPPQRNLSRLLDTFDVCHLSVSDLAHLSGRSLSSFNRDFKAIYQQTPKKWLLDKKLSRAEELLFKQEMSVTEVAFTLGYENVSAFINAFKQKYGVTPKQIKAI